MNVFEEALNQYCFDMVGSHAIVLIVVNFFTVFLTVFLGFWFNRKLENVKKRSELLLKKSEGYHELQLQAIKSLYPKLLRMEMRSTALIQRIETEPNEIQIRLSNWIDAYLDLLVTYEENELFLDEKTSLVLKKYLSIHEELYQRFLSNRDAIRLYEYACKNANNDEGLLSPIRAQLKESSIELSNAKKEFQDNNPDLIIFLKKRFRRILIPSK